ncbi:hypothetical protein BC777_1752 [Yoonia maricola]|uniref:Phytase-like domain-containing protein n=1 Tax=Yoonia maricola TaxID=420999 RepID=A0A2M8WPN3_9RHOB|nr:hypothetical protein [Yoonia maricola]PJI92888.1 hypothetical protein BC777_1752 [Yoonia maricola]
MRTAITFLMLLAAPATALELTYQTSYDLNRPASLDYDPTFCGLWIANEGPEVILVTLQGDELRRLTSDLTRIKAITIEGDNLLVADGLGSFQRITKNGVALADPFQSDVGWADTEGLTITEDGTVIMVEDDPERMTWLNPDGTIQRQISTLSLDPPLTEAQGIARDPRTGHLLIVDDMEGTNSLYEFDATGTLLGTTSLRPYGMDPEGIAIRPGSGQVFIAFDSGATIASFDYQPTLPTGADPLPPESDCLMF